MNFYVCITTIKKYKAALEVLLDSLPSEWKNKYILVYQNENQNNFRVFEDGHIEVYMINNQSDYGSYIGINMLLEANIVSQDSWFLFIHDTCKFLGSSCVDLTYNLINSFNNTDTEIVWLSHNGQCNICLIRKKAIQFGSNIYKDIKFMTKKETIDYEWNHAHSLSPKSFNVKQFFVNTPTQHLGKRYVYNNINERDCLLYETINMEKYYYSFPPGSDHPMSP
jgi:hypothetical protein